MKCRATDDCSIADAPRFDLRSADYGMRYLSSLVALTSLVSCARPVASRPPAEPQRMRVVGYLAGWGVQTKGTRIAEIPGQHLTHINYAFALIGDDGRMVHGDPCIDIGECEGAPRAQPI